MTNASPRRVLIAGGTGGTGRLVVHRLGTVCVPARVLTRDRRHARRLGPVEVVEGNALVEDDCGRAVDGCDAVICTLGVHSTGWKGPVVDGAGVINLARAAEQMGAHHFVLVSALGVGDSWAWIPLPVKWLARLIGAPPVLREKARAEDYLRSSRLAWTILRPGFLHGGRMRTNALLTAGGQLPGLCGRRTLADVAVRCLSTQNAQGHVLAIADGWLRRWLRGEAFQLDVPWEPW